MYLNLLNDEQKKCFLDYAYQLANADGHYSEIEQEMMLAYCEEMHISFADRVEDHDVATLVETLKRICTEQEKKIILFEALGLALVDNKYNEEENKMISYMQHEFGLNDDFVEICKVYVEEYIQLQSKINEAVLAM